MELPWEIQVVQKGILLSTFDEYEIFFNSNVYDDSRGNSKRRI